MKLLRYDAKHVLAPREIHTHSEQTVPENPQTLSHGQYLGQSETWDFRSHSTARVKLGQVLNIVTGGVGTFTDVTASDYMCQVESLTTAGFGLY